MARARPRISHALVAVAAAGGVSEWVRRRRSSREAPPPPPPTLTTQSSPGQIAELQQAYGADMAPQVGERAKQG